MTAGIWFRVLELPEVSPIKLQAHSLPRCPDSSSGLGPLQRLVSILHCHLETHIGGDKISSSSEITSNEKQALMQMVHCKY